MYLIEKAPECLVLSLVIPLSFAPKPLFKRVIFSSHIYFLTSHWLIKCLKSGFHLYHHSNHQWAPHCGIQWLQLCDTWYCFSPLLETNHFLGFLDTKLSLFTSSSCEDFFSISWDSLPLPTVYLLVFPMIFFTPALLQHIYPVTKIICPKCIHQEKWYWWTYLQGGNRDTDVVNGPVDVAGEGEGGMNWESSIDIYTLPCAKYIARRKLLYNTGSSAWCSVMS